jgi:hypothetical protein
MKCTLQLSDLNQSRNGLKAFSKFFNYNLDENSFNVSCVAIYIYKEGGRSKLLY